MANYRTEFPDFDYELPVIEGFRDESWHNDTCPNISNGRLTVWCDYADASLREFPDSTYPRFNVTTAEMDNGGMSLFETDDVAALVAWLKEHA